MNEPTERSADRNRGDIIVERHPSLPEQFARFRDFCDQLYEGDPFYRSAPPPPSDGKLITVERDGEILCGGVLLENSQMRRGIDIEGTGTIGTLGWYESVDDLEVAATFFEAVRATADDLGLETIIGPLNHDTWHSYRLAIDPEHPFFLEPYNKPWYPRQWTENGFRRIASYHSTLIPLHQTALSETDNRVDRFVQRFADRGVTIRPVETNRFEEEVAIIHAISLDGFSDNPFYSPISYAEMERLYSPLRKLIDPRFVMIAESQEDGPVGFLFCVTDPTVQQKRLIVKSVAVTRAPVARGLGTLMIEMVHKRAAEAGYQEAIHALMHDSNSSANILGESSRLVRRYELYGSGQCTGRVSGTNE